MEMEDEEVQLQGAQVVGISNGESDNQASMKDGGDEEQIVMSGADLQGMGQRD